jgi:hypothetical protein
MSRDSALSGGALVPSKPGPVVWLWPVAAALLAAWPVWRSLFPEVPDLGEGWLRLELIAGLALAALSIAWRWLRPRKVKDLDFPAGLILLAAGSALFATSKDNPSEADVYVTVLAWTVMTMMFASVTLIKTADAGAMAGCRPVRWIDLFPPVLWIAATGAAACVFAFFAGLTLKTPIPMMAIVSPGAILAWASLSDTARSILTKRQVHFADAEVLLDLAARRRWYLRTPTILVNDRVKLAGLHTNKDVEPVVKPGELVGLAAATTMDEETDIGRAIQEFGVSHRVRLPALRQRRDGDVSPGRQATLANGAIIELSAIEDSLDLSAHAEAIELAQTQHRIVMAVVERAPNPRVLGILVFGIGARGGATEALRVLRDRHVEVALSAPARNPADEVALKSLSVKHASFDPSKHQDVTSVWRGGVEADVGDGLNVAFGGAGPTASSAMHLVVGREDARSLVDLARFADDFRTRIAIVSLLSSMPGLVLIASAFGYVPVTPFLVTGVAVIGIAIATITPQVLRLSPVLDNEGTED